MSQPSPVNRSSPPLPFKEFEGFSTEAEPSMCTLLESPEVITWLSILLTTRQVCGFLESRLTSRGYTLPRFQIFFYLYFFGPRSASQLAKDLLVTRGNISSFLKRLIAENLIEKIPSPKHKKRKLSQLTGLARKEFEELLPEHIKRIREVVRPLDSACLEDLRVTAKAGCKAREVAAK